ncbi:precorrin-2 dehydrogenase/sirohydrochlorin ferrochelatase family protein [Peptostreptococcus canis]|uniref:precorrin-2 dehydrogenase n=1 Tax=Peptostreptococcus canis TaxID=1159213 RepID=A0ABR6TIT1_9FIRM|nr:bifunctional precorrin-2 dehydrogenase/sirohydrochlorin ferrochelatase [Peptostreptococcus canis]MBC2575326.1 bifunctional precorrin-2 dehydrogenase/sirohydrochlorin ferrochelatase [Peptostreptococcus canis]MBP1997491.1 siroheme synthase-like protein [Peptostreptococcus canis]
MFYPIMVDLEKLNILVIGGGKISYRKVYSMIGYVEKIIIISPEFIDDFLELEKKFEGVILIKKKVEYVDIDNMDLVFAATDNTELNSSISEYCKNKKILINSVDNHKNSNFINMAFFETKYDSNDIIVSVSCLGKNPAILKRIKNKLKYFFE